LLLPDPQRCVIAVIGLGYVGLPLAVEFSKPKSCLRTGSVLRRRVIGFDINQKRLEELKSGFDCTNEISSEELVRSEFLQLTNSESNLSKADVFVVTVPTPIDSSKKPDLTALKKASATVGKALKTRAKDSYTINPLVIYESTVYPGATEEVCVPILEKESGLIFNIDFFCGYSPERINPGDKAHRLTTIIKVTSGSTPEAADWIDGLYGSIIDAGTHKATSMKVAEAAKAIENTQRDLNIALVNELAMIFNKLGIDTLDVLEAAGTKWNFLPFHPGLVGGHCIGVDPYYLTHKAQQVGYHPEVVLAGRRINDGMSDWIVGKLIMEMSRRGMVICKARVLILGLTFKENCPDLRNTQAVKVIKSLNNYGIFPEVVDPLADSKEAKQEYGIEVQDTIPDEGEYVAILVLIAHTIFKEMSNDKWKSLIGSNGILYDVKGIAPREIKGIRL